MIVNISFENFDETMFDERVSVRMDIPILPQIGSIIYLPELILSKLDRIVESLPRKEADDIVEPLADDQIHYFEDFIYVSDVGLKMDDEYAIWIQLTDNIE